MKEKELYEFGGFRLDVAEHFLAHLSGKRVPLSEKAFATLCVLVRNGGHLVRKEELLNKVWEDSFVEENNLDKCIYAVRRALGEKPGEQKFIETVRKHGYRLVVKVCRVEAEVLPIHQKNLTHPAAKQIPLTRFLHRSEQTESENATQVLHATTGDAEMQTAKTQPDFWQHIRHRKLLVTFTVFAALLAGAIVFYQYWTSNQTPSAQDLYLQGRFYSVRENKPDNDKAIQLLEQAVAVDPNHALVHAELARAYGTLYFQFEPQQRQWQEKSHVELEKAFALKPDLAEAHEIRGFLLWMPANRFPHEQAIAAYRRALVSNPNLDEPHQALGKIYLHIGLFEEALTEFHKALELNPSNTMARYRIGIVLIHQGKFEEALRSLKSTPPEINPTIVGRDTVWLLISLGRREEAADLLNELVEKNPTDEGGQFAGFKALLSAIAGNAAQAEREIQDALKKGKGFGHFHHTAYIIACTYAALNNPEQAVRFLQMAADDGYPCYPLFERDPNLDAIRQNPKFQSFLSVQKQQREHYKSLPQL